MLEETEYDKQNNIIELFDNVKILRDNESISGNYAKINTLTESYKVTSKESGRLKLCSIEKMNKFNVLDSGLIVQ